LIVDTLVQCEPGASAVPASKLEDDLPLGPGGLGVSSLLLLQVFVRLEEKLGFAFDDAAVANAKFTTVGELVGFVEEVLRRQQLGHAGAITSPATGGS
jgi:acyl carrier protein